MTSKEETLFTNIIEMHRFYSVDPCIRRDDKLGDDKFGDDKLGIDTLNYHH